MNRSLRDPRAYRDAPAGAATHDASRFERLRRLLSRMGVAAIETDVDLDGGYLGDGPDDDGRRARAARSTFPSRSPRRAATVR